MDCSIELAQSTVARYMTRKQGPPSHGWKTFLRSHTAGIASIDLFVVRTISFKCFPSTLALGNLVHGGLLLLPSPIFRSGEECRHSNLNNSQDIALFWLFIGKRVQPCG